MIYKIHFKIKLHKLFGVYQEKKKKKLTISKNPALINQLLSAVSC